LHKKLAAALTISIFLLSTLAILAPVNAHFTLGNLTDSPRYRTDDFDPHYNGVIGYVWPGAGSNTYFGYPNSIPSNLLFAPGYQSPYPGQKPPLAPSPTWYQVEGNAYSPFGAILVGSTGDLIFAINATSSSTAGPTFKYGNWSSWYILIPPEFTGVTKGQVVSTLTNEYGDISVRSLSADDRYAPGWTAVQVSAEGTHNNRYINFTAAGGLNAWYYVRINGVKAPTIAGRYFFKMLLDGNSSDPSKALATPKGYNYTYWVPPQNWPVVLVKGEIDPAIITGTIMYGGFNIYTPLYNNPVQEAGKVWAHMTAKIDPYTNQPITGGQLTDAVAYFNATAKGHYELEGLAAGVYDIYASVAGYPTTIIAPGVTVLKGQSLHFNGYVNPGVVIHGTVYSKHSFGDEPFPRNDYVKVEIYDKPTVGSGYGQLASGLLPVSWSPLPSIAANDTGAKGIFSNSGKDKYETLMESYWPVDSTTYAGFAGGQAQAYDGNYYQQNVEFPWHAYYGDNFYDPQGVGPAQTWYVHSGANLFLYQFGEKGLYGAPRDLDGHVPQIFSTWVNGLTPGRYYVRVWLTQYVQTQIDGATFREYYFDVAANEWAGDVAVPLDLLLGSYVVKTVHLHDTPGTLATQPDSTGALYLHATLVDAAGTVWAHNITAVTPGTDADPKIVLAGVDRRWDGKDYGIPAGVYKPMTYMEGYVQQTFDMVALSLSGTPVYISNHLYRGVGWNITAYSIDFEQPRVDRMWQWGGEPLYISIVDSTGTEVDKNKATQSSTVNNVWVSGDGVNTALSHTHGVFFGSSASYDNEGGFAKYIGIFNRDLFTDWYDDSTSFESGQYSLKGYTYGYIQNKDFTYFGQKGQVVDGKVNLIIGVNLTIQVVFKKEHILTATPWNMSMRVRVFDDSGALRAEWMTSDEHYPLTNAAGTIKFNYLPAGTASVTIHTAGIDEEVSTQDDAGDPAGLAPNAYGIPGAPDYTGGYSVEVDFVNWYNGYDPVTGAGPGTYWYPPPIGLLEGESFHTVPGSPAGPFGYTGTVLAANHLGPYGQEGVWSLPNAHESGEVSGVWEVDQRGYVGGGLTAFTWSNERRPVSWALFSVSGAPLGNTTLKTYSLDGTYDGFLPGGTYSLTITEPGYTAFTTPFVVTEGQATAGLFVEIQRANIPIPEFSGLAVVLLSTLAASLFLLRRRRH